MSYCLHTTRRPSWRDYISKWLTTAFALNFSSKISTWRGKINCCNKLMNLKMAGCTCLDEACSQAQVWGLSPEPGPNVCWRKLYPENIVIDCPVKLLLRRSRLYHLLVLQSWPHCFASPKSLGHAVARTINKLGWQAEGIRSASDNPWRGNCQQQITTKNTYDF